MRNIFVADTDEEARRIARPAMEYHLAHLNYLRTMHGANDLATRINVPRAANLEESLADGSVIAGSPDTVRAARLSGRWPRSASTICSPTSSWRP